MHTKRTHLAFNSALKQSSNSKFLIFWEIFIFVTEDMILIVKTSRFTSYRNEPLLWAPVSFDLIKPSLLLSHRLLS